MTSVTWIKLSIGIFLDEKIRLIEAMPEADSILVIWIKLLVQAGRCNADGEIFISPGRPYRGNEYTTLLGRPLPKIAEAMKVLTDLGMIEVSDDGILKIVNWEKHQNTKALEKIREDTRRRVAEHRARAKANHDACNALRNDDVTGKKKKEEYTSDILQLSDLLAQKILSNNPKHRHLSNGKYRETIQNWAADIDKLHRLDGQSIEDIRKVIEWSQADDFWKKNILSGASLREKWDRLLPAAIEKKSAPGKESWR